jgi:hypothetical protein
MTPQSATQSTTAHRAPFEVIPFASGEWKVLDWKRGRYIRAYDSFTRARRYASARNRKGGFFASAVVRNAPPHETTAPCSMSETDFDALLERHRRALGGAR